jgi:lipoate-protein ligase A
MTRDAILESFAGSFARRYRSSLSDYTPDEIEAAQRLVDEKFATPEWTHRVP